MMVHVGIVEHDLAASAQRATAVGLAFDEAVHQPTLEVLRARAHRQIEAGIADGVIDAVDVERVAHHRMPDAIAAAGTDMPMDERWERRNAQSRVNAYGIID